MLKKSWSKKKKPIRVKQNKTDKDLADTSKNIFETVSRNHIDTRSSHNFVNKRKDLDIKIEDQGRNPYLLKGRRKSEIRKKRGWVVRYSPAKIAFNDSLYKLPKLQSNSCEKSGKATKKLFNSNKDIGRWRYKYTEMIKNKAKIVNLQTTFSHFINIQKS